MPILLFLLTIFSRLPFTSKYLYHMDSGHFALALDTYDLLLHQPHPPGYFLYVLLAKVLHLFVSDVNAVFVIISIFFSALTTVVIYYLGKEMFDEKLGTIAAFLALTSPNFWFHGEIALSYPIEAFFSAIIGLQCWRIFKGRKEYFWISIVLLALAGGFRQNSAVFLLPVWLLSVRHQSPVRIFAGIALGGIVILAWFVPMVMMTGGLDVYRAAFRELWQFNTGHNSVFEKGLPRLKQFTLTVNGFLFFTLGAAMPFSLVSLYATLRNGRISLLKESRTTFLACWVLPSLLFYLLVFIHPANPGYVLILLPPLAVACSAALLSLGGELVRLTGKNVIGAPAWIVMLMNVGIFLFLPLPVSLSEVMTHDRNIAAILRRVAAFNPKTTALFVGPYSFYSYRHLMVYLPEFTVYQVDVRTSEAGERRKQFGGVNGKTFLTEKIRVPKGVTAFASVILDEPLGPPRILPRLSIEQLAPEIRIVSGSIDGVCQLYPELTPLWDSAESTHGLTARVVSKGNDHAGIENK